MELLVRLSGLWFLICSAGTSADANGSKVKVKVKEGSDVMLPCSISTNIELKFFGWMKDGQKEVFLYNAGLHSNNGLPGQDEQFKGRVSHFEDELKSGNASILIRNMTVADSGDYTCEFPRLQPSGQISHVQLVVVPVLKDRSGEHIPGAAQRPYVTILKTYLGARLQCEVKGASPEPKVEWQDSAGNIVPAEKPQVSQSGGRYDVILETTVFKTDNFHCVATQKEIQHRTQAEIYAHGFPTEWAVGGGLGGVIVVLIVIVLKLCTRGSAIESVY